MRKIKLPGEGSEIESETRLLSGLDRYRDGSYNMLTCFDPKCKVSKGVVERNATHEWLLSEQFSSQDRTTTSSSSLSLVVLTCCGPRPGSHSSHLVRHGMASGLALCTWDWWKECAVCSVQSSRIRKHAPAGIGPGRH